MLFIFYIFIHTNYWLFGAGVSVCLTFSNVLISFWTLSSTSQWKRRMPCKITKTSKSISPYLWIESSCFNCAIKISNHLEISSTFSKFSETLCKCSDFWICCAVRHRGILAIHKCYWLHDRIVHKCKFSWDITQPE